MRTFDLNDTWQLLETPLCSGASAAACLPAAAWDAAIDAVVPGEVHLDLLRHGRIAEPLYDRNAAACAWVEERAWWYRRTFTHDGVAGVRAELVCEGLDLNAALWLNGIEIGRSANAYIAHRFDVTRALRTGANELVIRLDTGVAEAKRKPLAKYGINADGAPESKWLRKPAFTFGWDWAPRLVNCGIWRPVRLEFLDAVTLRDVWVRTRLAEKGRAVVTVVAEVENVGSAPADATLRLAIPGIGEQTLELPGLAPGKKRVEAVFEVARPRLWWPRPLGKPHRYTLETEFSCGGAAGVSRRTCFGIREIKLVQEPLWDVPEGKSFTFVVNGEKVFVNGANWAPSDGILARITPQRREKLLTLIRDANINMLRVWGGGIFEEDDFYDYCDAHGILIWHDFMMACFIYPGDDAGFRQQIAEETRAAVTRLRNHPSIAVWCGSNESDWAFDNNWYPGCEANTSLVLEHELIPGLMKELDPDRPYRPTSPFGGADVNDEDQGDQHWWSISIATGGNDQIDYRNYRRAHCTFNSEFGYFGMPALESMQDYLPESQRAIDAEGFRFHTNRHGFMEKGQKGQLKVFAAIDLLAGDSSAMTLEQLVEASQLLQADALKTATEQARRRKFDCGGSMFWMFPDSWGEIGWSVVDYYLRKKAAYDYVRQACAPVLVSIKEEECGVSTWIVNDTRQRIRGTLECSLLSFEGKVHSRRPQAVDIRRNASVRCVLDRMNLMRSGDFYHARVTGPEGVIAENIFFFLNFKSVKMSPAKVSVTVLERGTGRAVLRLTTDMFAHFVRVDPPAGLDTDDRCFDLLPGSSRDIVLQGDASLVETVRVRWRNR
ncbi:MAG: beta-mannosidase [Kiritimatiellia bacterium]